MTETFYATQQVRVLPGQGWPPAGIECCVVRRRAIGKWLNAGVMEAGELSYPQQGTPQGGVISATLSNVYLHEVLDQWFEREVKPRLRGRAFEVRYADDGAGVRARRRREAGAWGCWRNEWRDTVCACIRTRRGWWRFAGRRSRSGAARSASAASRCWGSPTTGDAPGRGDGWSSARRRRTDSAECRETSVNGAEGIGTRACPSSTWHRVASCADTMPTTASPGTRRHWRDSGTRSADDGTNGSADGAGEHG